MLFFTVSAARAQNCDIATTGVALVNAANTAPVLSGCVGQAYNFKFSIANFGSDPNCTIPANTVTAVFDFPTIAGNIKPYIYNGPASFVSGYFTWTYNSTDEVLQGTNTTPIPNADGDANILVPVMAVAAGTGSSALNLSQGGGVSDNIGNNTGIAQFTVNPSPVVSNQPDQLNCNNSSFTMTQSGTGTWSLVSGTASISNPASPVTTVTGVPLGSSATLRWSVSNGTCTATDDVTVSNNAAPVSAVSAVVNNTCHGGSNGSISMSVGIGYTFTIAGPTVNTTGQVSGIFTGLSAGNYTITVWRNGCSSTYNATVTEPAGTLPDISLGSDYDANFFFLNGQENNIVFNVSEVAGNAATGDTIRIIRIPGYTFGFAPAAASISIGSTLYTLDNSNWKLDNSAPSFISVIYDPAHNSTPGTLNCSGRKFVALTITRNTANSATFTLSARLRKANNETNLANNLNTIVFSAE